MTTINYFESNFASTHYTGWIATIAGIATRPWRKWAKTKFIHRFIFANYGLKWPCGEYFLIRMKILAIFREFTVITFSLSEQ